MEKENKGCGKLCYDKEIIKDLVVCGQKFRTNKNSLIKIFLCGVCNKKNEKKKN